jgi:hypothetical protein
MRAQTQTLIPHYRSRVGQIAASVRTLSERSTPTEIRLDIQKLLALEQLELPHALGDVTDRCNPASDVQRNEASSRGMNKRPEGVDDSVEVVAGMRQ